MELHFIRGDGEDIRVLREGLLVAQREQGVAELFVTRASQSHLFKRNRSVVLFVEVLEGVAQLHQVVLPHHPHDSHPRC